LPATDLQTTPLLFKHLGNFDLLEGAQISTCENAITAVEGGSFKYFRVVMNSNVQRVSVEVIDISGKTNNPLLIRYIRNS